VIYILLARPINAHIFSHKAGHKLDTIFAKNIANILNRKNNFEQINSDKKRI